MNAVISLCVLGILFSVATGQFLNCDWIKDIDCSSYSTHEECGTDATTYDNRCLFAKSNCNNTNLHIRHSGACIPGEFTTPPSVTGTPGGTTSTPHAVHGQVAVLDFFCTALSHKTCPTTVEEVCGTDNLTYMNVCEYEKQRCTHRKLTVKHFGRC